MMVRTLRILCVVCIAFILTSLTLMINQTINVIDWLNYFKIAFAILMFSLVYLLLDTKRETVTGKIAFFSSVIGMILLVFSIKFAVLNTFLHVSIGTYLLSFVLVLNSKIEFSSILHKIIYTSILLIPLGIILDIKIKLFYSFSMLILLLSTILLLINAYKKAKN